MNWFKSKLNIEDRLIFLEKKIATTETPLKFITGDEVWYKRWDGAEIYTYHKAIVVKPRIEFIRGHACMTCYNYYLILCNKMAFEVDEDYLTKHKPNET